MTVRRAAADSRAGVVPRSRADAADYQPPLCADEPVHLPEDGFGYEHTAPPVLLFHEYGRDIRCRIQPAGEGQSLVFVWVDDRAVPRLVGRYDSGRGRGHAAAGFPPQCARYRDFRHVPRHHPAARAQGKARAHRRADGYRDELVLPLCADALAGVQRVCHHHLCYCRLGAGRVALPRAGGRHESG